MSLSIYLNDEIQTPEGKIRVTGVIARETKKAGSRSGSAFLISDCTISSLGAAIMRCCSEIQVLRYCNPAVLWSEGSRDEGRGKRQEEGVGRVRKNRV
jgi:hypothetical protein